MEEVTFAPKIKRFGAYIIDFFILFVFWYLLTKKDLEKVNVLLETLDPDAVGAADIFAEAIIKLYVSFIFKLMFVEVLYYCLVPAVLGKGRTVGKLIFKINLVSRDTGEELSVPRLFLRELLGRAIIETLFVIPLFVSMFMLLFTEDGKTIRDLLGRSITVEQV
ncbi:MAG: RDD family protein [Candidatus Borkfalkiaceae bacterium]|nr:RDD family protein [Christensenellaceae bacterium]